MVRILENVFISQNKYEQENWRLLWISSRPKPNVSYVKSVIQFLFWEYCHVLSAKHDWIETMKRVELGYLISNFWGACRPYKLLKSLWKPVYLPSLRISLALVVTISLKISKAKEKFYRVDIKKRSFTLWIDSIYLFVFIKTCEKVLTSITKELLKELQERYSVQTNSKSK
jgi:hypothetical protein